MYNFISIGTIMVDFFLAIGCSWIAFEVIRWITEIVTDLGLNKTFMGLFRAGIGFVVFCIVYWAIAIPLENIIPNSNVGVTIFTIITVGIGGIMAVLAASFLLFKWIRAGIIKLFKKLPGSDKTKLFAAAIIVLIIAVIVFM